MQLKENQSLAPFTTFGIGGPARWFVEAAGESEIVEAVEWAGQRKAALFVLGGGSNLLVSDAGFDGLVIRVALRGIAAIDAGASQRIYRAAAGETWEDCVQRSVNDGCAGVECLSGIPGTVGGTPVQNVGAYGQEVSTVIERVRAFDRHERAFVEFSAAECAFAYRQSRFNTADRGRFIITRVDYRLTAGGAPTLLYPELKRAVEALHPDGSQPSLNEVAAAVRRIRHSKGMLLVEGDPDCRSAGSFFKNPVLGEDQLQKIAARGQNVPPFFPAGPDSESTGLVKIPAAWLIEHAGFAKGFSLDAAAISSRHTLALVNCGGATAGEILALARRIREAVELKFGVHLEIEPVLAGF